MGGLNKETRRKVSDWFGGYDTGLSSEAIAITAMTGFAPPRANYPHDPADFLRCYRLLEAVPDIREPAFSVLKDEGRIWPKLIARWADIEAAIIEDGGPVFERGASADKSYKLMREIIES